VQILALPITVIGTYFAAEYEEYLRRQVRSQYKPQIRVGGTAEMPPFLLRRRKSTQTTRSG